MQLTTLILSVFLGLSAAASSDVSSLISQLPSCGQTCLVSGAAAANCEATDYSCQCDNEDTIIANSTSCIVSSCSVSDISSKMPIFLKDRRRRKNDRLANYDHSYPTNLHPNL